MRAFAIALLISAPVLFLALFAVGVVIGSTRITRKGDPS